MIMNPVSSRLSSPGVVASASILGLTSFGEIADWDFSRNALACVSRQGSEDLDDVVDGLVDLILGCSLPRRYWGLDAIS